MAPVMHAKRKGENMATCFDVAAFILELNGPMTAMKLQKLVYYSQAWALVWDEEPIFQEDIEAWANGPVVPLLFKEHKGQFSVSAIAGGDPKALLEKQQNTVIAVLGYYGDKSSQWLSDLTHMEDPWKNARGGCADGDSCSSIITHAALHQYYGSLDPNS